MVNNYRAKAFDGPRVVARKKAARCIVEKANDSPGEWIVGAKESERGRELDGEKKNAVN